MTLIELLITMSIVGAIALVTASATVVILRQQNDTEARLDVARWEQGLGTWLPADLASATDVSADASATQDSCTIAACTEGLNALLVSWDNDGVTVSVSYRYGPTTAGSDTYQLTRVRCEGSSCTSHVVLNNLDGPRGSDGELVDWATVTEVPNAIIDVTVPLDVNATSEDGPLDPDDCDFAVEGDACFKSPARRVIVEVNGRPDEDGEVRSSRVSITAGGKNREAIDAPTFEGITFTEARSGCGGPTTLVIDRSGSISSNLDNVKTGIKAFVSAFDGTPTDLEVIEFSNHSSSWSAYDSVASETITRFDLSNPNHVDLLIGPGELADQLTAGGGTNWEDALHRTFYQDDGTIDSPRPGLVVFFTDGIPTFSRTSTRSDGYGPSVGGTKDTNSADASSVGPTTIESPYDYISPTGSTGGYVEGTVYNPAGWSRANHIIRQFDVRTIGVGVGGFSGNTSFSGSPRTAGWPSSVPNEAFLGKLIAGGLPHQYNAGSPGYVKREYDPNPAVGWGDVSEADILVTNQWGALGDGLKAIALVDCGGTLTVQTTEPSGAPANAEVTYEAGGEIVTTTLIQKAKTFDVALGDGTATTIQVVPQPLDGTGYTAQSWLCRAGGSDMDFGTEYSLIDPVAGASAGIEVTVSPNEAVSCTMTVN